MSRTHKIDADRVTGLVGFLTLSALSFNDNNHQADHAD
jgi:hypothetical protein